MRLRLPVIVAIACLPASMAHAQARADSAARDSLIPDSRLFVRSDAWVLAGFVGATVAMFPFDRRVTEWVRSERFIGNATLNRVEHTLDFLGGPAPLMIGGVLYVTGRIAGLPRAAHLAVHTSEAVIVGIATAGTLKMLLGRARPYVSADTNPANFGFARGVSGDDYQSFPSGHASVSFAVAAAVTAETAEWWPGARWVVGPALYGGAALVGLSRMYDDKHWASDVVMGAAIGTFAGLKTVRFNHTRTGNRVDRWLLGEGATARFRVTPQPDGSWHAGVGVSW